MDLNATEADDVVDIYFLPPFSGTTEAGGKGGVSLPPFEVDTRKLDRLFMNAVFMSLYAVPKNAPYMVAHELMHILTNEGDVTAPDHIFFPTQRSRTAEGTSGTTVTTRRRMTAETAAHAITERPAPEPENNKMGFIGNRLLRSP